MERHLAMNAAILKREHPAVFRPCDYNRLTREAHSQHVAPFELGDVRDRIPKVWVNTDLAQVK
jgi:hypothetical protein